MDDIIFDQTLRRLASTTPRRRVLGALVAGSATLAGGRLAGAKAGGQGKGKGKGNGQPKMILCHAKGKKKKPKTITVAAPAVAAHLAHGDTLGACKNSACLPVTGFDGDVSTPQAGGFTLTTAGANDYGSISFAVPAGTLFSALSTLESGFDFTTGSCGAGTPRFVVRLKNGKCPYVAFPPTECGTEGADGFTGALVGNNTPWLWNDDLCGGNQSNNTYALVLAAYGSEEVDHVVLVNDTSHGESTVTVDPCVRTA